MVRILIVDDDTALRDSIAETIADLGHVPVAAPDGAAALARLAQGGIDGVLLDLRMPGLDGIEVLRRLRALPASPPVAVLTAVPTAGNTIEAMRLGAVDHLAKPVGRDDLAALIARMLPAPAAAGSPPSGLSAAEGDELVGSSAPMREVQKAIGRLADSEATVLITGETGTGKEVVARAIHRHGRRGGRCFVAVNCAAIPAALLESQLFGHARGAFTGAIADRAGSFREADGGTLFLDEIGDMDLTMQAKLLRVLQERTVTPVGGRAVPVDVRILAATHRDLRAMVAAGGFREDLFYRIGVVPVHLAPLRERLSDILPPRRVFSGPCRWRAPVLGRGGGAAAGASLAGQCARTAQRHGARRRAGAVAGAVRRRLRVSRRRDRPGGRETGGGLAGRRSARRGRPAGDRDDPPRPGRLRRQPGRGGAPAEHSSSIAL